MIASSSGSLATGTARRIETSIATADTDLSVNEQYAQRGSGDERLARRTFSLDMYPWDGEFFRQAQAFSEQLVDCQAVVVGRDRHSLFWQDAVPHFRTARDGTLSAQRRLVRMFSSVRSASIFKDVENILSGFGWLGNAGLPSAYTIAATGNGSYDTPTMSDSGILTTSQVESTSGAGTVEIRRDLFLPLEGHTLTLTVDFDSVSGSGGTITIEIEAFSDSSLASSLGSNSTTVSATGVKQVSYTLPANTLFVRVRVWKFADTVSTTVARSIAVEQATLRIDDTTATVIGY